MIKVYRYNRSEVGKGKSKQTFYYFKSLLTTYVPLVIFCTSNYPMSCSFVSSRRICWGKSQATKKLGYLAAVREEKVFKERVQEDVDPV